MGRPVRSVDVDRRQIADRRSQPTTFWGIWRLGGRRKGFRRAGEAYQSYVDCPSRRVLVLLSIVIGASVLDALLTLLYLHDGGAEANPLMALAIKHGEARFVGIKMALTGIGAWLLAAHQHFPLALRGLHVLATGYVGLLLIHAALLLR
jgi:Domain of unknown function (DUF5658)